MLLRMQEATGHTDAEAANSRDGAHAARTLMNGTEGHDIALLKEAACIHSLDRSLFVRDQY